MARRRTRGQLVKAELGESFDHFMQAATHAAGGVGATMGPKAADGVQRVRDGASHGWESTMAALSPLAAAAAEGAREATKRAGSKARKAGAKKMRAASPMKESRMSRRRWPMLAGLLAAGTAVGATGALLMRRRKQQQWQEYEPGHAMEPMTADVEKTVDPSMNGTVDTARLDGVVDSTKGRH